MTWRFLPLAGHPHPDRVGPDHYGRQLAAREVLAMINQQDGVYVTMHTVPGTCPDPCNDLAHGSEDPLERCARAVTHLTVDVEGLRRSIDADSPDAAYDLQVVELAASVLGQGSVNLGALLDCFCPLEYDQLLSALALASGRADLQRSLVPSFW